MIFNAAFTRNENPKHSNLPVRQPINQTPERYNMALTLQSILYNAERKWRDDPYIFTREGSSFTAKTFGEFASDVRALSAGLIKRGLRGRHIMIIGENSYEWMVADYAACAFVGVSASINKDIGRDGLVEAIKKTDIAAVFYSQNLPYDVKSLDVLPDMPFYSLQSDLYRVMEPEYQTAGKTGKGPNAVGAPLFDRPGNNGSDDTGADERALCKIYFTSGTTGFPKAAMLSQKNIFSGVEGLSRRAPIDERDGGYLFLPLSHTYGGIYNFIYSLIYGTRLYLCSDTRFIAEELQMTRPTIFCAVPNVLEKFLGAARASDNPNETPARRDGLSGNAAKALRNMFGGNLRYLFCSGGPWTPANRAIFKKAGLNLLEAYALTETASSFSLAYSGDAETESVGVVMENLDVVIDGPDANQRGEILVRGDNVFLGYYNDTEATNAAIDADGYLHTGDIGRLDSSRRLYLTGRKNRLFKSSSGEFVSPDHIVRLLLSKQGIKTATIINNSGHVKAMLGLSNLSADVAGLIDEVNAELPAHMRIVEYTFFEAYNNAGQKK